ncbi:NADPH-dependent 7-cyano-7-deazaguanine reductase QueF [Gammaproteobacteria bacterium 45_16_T64]|nr:NADPH-dependent 7-cyano-7-deazaguanine reductase QueF [Gammaproteobacteria bacterium 45_16_T64]
MKDVVGSPEHSPLGKDSAYPDQYDPSLLYPIPRSQGRGELDDIESLPFNGVDIWNAYEVSWLDPKGKPRVAIAVLAVSALSENIVESKSLKLYLGSLNQSVYRSVDEVANIIKGDVQAIVRGDVVVDMELLVGQPSRVVSPAAVEGLLDLRNAVCVDDLDVDITHYSIEPALLCLDQSDDEVVDECVSSHLLRSNCPVTGQPDWATVFVHYRGKKICRGSFLKYIISYRNHNDFHEQCVERIFVDVMRACGPTDLSVYARYTRRGGIDINPFRSNFESCVDNTKLGRQ